MRGDAEEGRDYGRNAVIWLWDRTRREDHYIITRNSYGVHSRFFEPGPYHPEHESMCIEFVDSYQSALARPEAPGRPHRLFDRAVANYDHSAPARHRQTAAYIAADGVPVLTSSPAAR